MCEHPMLPMEGLLRATASYFYHFYCHKANRLEPPALCRSVLRCVLSSQQSWQRPPREHSGAKFTASLSDTDESSRAAPA